MILPFFYIYKIDHFQMFSEFNIADKLLGTCHLKCHSFITQQNNTKGSCLRPLFRSVEEGCLADLILDSWMETNRT